MLDNAGLEGVPIERSKHPGLSDHYDPRNRTLFLSEGVFGIRSISAIAVASPTKPGTRFSMPTHTPP